MLDGMFLFVLVDNCDNFFIVVCDFIGIIFFYFGWGFDGIMIIIFNFCNLMIVDRDIFLEKF